MCALLGEAATPLDTNYRVLKSSACSDSAANEAPARDAAFQTGAASSFTTSCGLQGERIRQKMGEINLQVEM